MELIPLPNTRRQLFEALFGIVHKACCCARTIRTACSKIVKRIDTDSLLSPTEVMTLAHGAISFGSEIRVQ